MWNDIPYTVFDTGTLDEFKGAVTVECFPELCFLQFSVVQVLVGLQKQLIKNVVFPTWACAAGFNNNSAKGDISQSSPSREANEISQDNEIYFTNLDLSRKKTKRILKPY